jgi:hypothetical protein
MFAKTSCLRRNRRLGRTQGRLDATSQEMRAGRQKPKKRVLWCGDLIRNYSFGRQAATCLEVSKAAAPRWSSKEESAKRAQDDEIEAEQIGQRVTLDRFFQRWPGDVARPVGPPSVKDCVQGCCRTVTAVGSTRRGREADQGFTVASSGRVSRVCRSRRPSPFGELEASGVLPFRDSNPRHVA